MSAALLAYLAARKRHKAAKKRRDIDAVIDALKDEDDREEDRVAALQTADAKAAARAARETTRKEELAQEGYLARLVRRTLDLLNLQAFQFLQYLVMLFCFQNLSFTMRNSNEFYFDSYMSSMFVANTFDHRHYSLRNVHKIADVYTWMENALTPAIFHNAPAGQAWFDGDGDFSLEGATPYSTADMVDEANVFALPQGLIFKQLRMRPSPASAKKHCYAGHQCFDQLEGLDDPGDRTPFGHANDATGMKANHFIYWDRKDLGANTGGVPSASHISGRLYASSGFIAAFRPFFSDTLLPNEEGDSPTAVTDFRPHEVTPHNGRIARYQCARYTTNGRHTVQRCDPSSSRNTGVIRGMFGEFLRYLKKGHWIDRQTALLAVSLQGENQNDGVRFSSRYLFEFSPLSGVLPSYDTETLISDPATLEDRELWLSVCLGLIGWFTFLECIEIVVSFRHGTGDAGPLAYLSSLWNLLDWTNFGLFFYVFLLCKHERVLVDRDTRGDSCTSMLCQDFGHFDAWEAFAISRISKMLFSFCVCIQLLKIVKFTNELVPKMSLMTRVLVKASGDLILFAVIFAISMFAFSMLFYMQLGSAVDNYYSIIYSFISLVRSLFGDFDIVEIIENSKNYLNGVLYLLYLFLSVFILLALFLSILGEAQSAVRDDEIAAEANGEDVDQYGVLSQLSEGVLNCIQACVTALGFLNKEEDDGRQTPEPALTEEDLRRQALAESLKAFRPTFVSMVERHIDTLESSLAQKLMGLEAALDEKDRRAAAAAGGRRAASTSPPKPKPEQLADQMRDASRRTAHRGAAGAIRDTRAAKSKKAPHGRAGPRGRSAERARSRGDRGRGHSSPSRQRHSNGASSAPPARRHDGNDKSGSRLAGAGRRESSGKADHLAC